MHPKVLVTGGCGYIGSHVLLHLAAAGIQAVVLDDLSTGRRDALLNDERLYVGNAGDQELVGRILNEHKIGAVLHFAAAIRVEESVSQPARYYANNTVNTLRLVEAVARAGVRSFVFSSTASVYGQAATMPVDEKAPTAPENPYGASKLMSERMLADIARTCGLRYVILRYFNVAGADPQGRLGQRTQDATHLIKVACEVAVGKRQHIAMFGTDYGTPDGTCIRDYIHVEDLADAHVRAFTYLERGGDSVILNCGYGHGSSVREVLAAVRTACGVPFKIVDGPRRAGDVGEVVADSTNIRRLLGWQPRYDDLATIVKHSYEWERRLLEEKA